MNKQDTLLRLAVLLSLAALLLLLIPMLALGRYAVPAADDYGFSAATHLAWEASGSPGQVLRAAAGQVRDTWYGWQGSFSGVFLMSLQPALFADRLYMLTPFVMLGALLLGVFSLSLTLFDGLFHADRRAALLLAAAVCLLCTQLLPSAVQGFYWWNGAIYYVFFHGLEMASIALAIRLVRKGGAGRELLLVLLAFFLGGGNYITALSCAILSVGSLCLTALLKTPGRQRLLLPTLALLLLPATLPMTVPAETTKVFQIQRREYSLKLKNASKDSRVQRLGKMERMLPAVATLGPKADIIM